MNPSISQRLAEARELAQGRHFIAAVALAESSVRLSMAERLLAVRPELKAFYGYKRLMGALQSFRAVDSTLAREIVRFGNHAWDATWSPSLTSSSAAAVVERAETLCSQLHAVQPLSDVA